MGSLLLETKRRGGAGGECWWSIFDEQSDSAAGRPDHVKSFSLALTLVLLGGVEADTRVMLV